MQSDSGKDFGYMTAALIPVISAHQRKSSYCNLNICLQEYVNNILDKI